MNMSMNRSQGIETTKTKAQLVADSIIIFSIVLFTLWQGSYFPLQFFLLIALLFVALLVFGKTLVITKEALLLLGITFLYSLSLVFLSENHYIGLVETLRTLVFPLSLILFLARRNINLEKPFLVTFVIIAIIGFFEVASIIIMPAGMDEGVGRLHSVLQYANATALLMLIGMLYTIGRFAAHKKIPNLLYFAIFSAALFLTGSRTTLVIALAVCTLHVFLLVSRKYKIIVLAVFSLAVVIVVCLGLFTEIRIFRLSIVTSTLVERFITFQDAFYMLRDRWYLGIGSGNWQHWQFRYQSAPYFVRFIHNYYLQLFLDGGILAPIFFCLAMFPAMFKGIRKKSVHGLILLAFVLHATLDIAPLFPAISIAAMYSLSKLCEKEFQLNLGKLRYAAIAPAIVLTVLWSSEFLSAQAVGHLNRGDLDSSMRYSKAAHALNPLNSDLYMHMSRSTGDNITLREEYVRRAVRANANDLRAISALVQFETRRGNYETALEFSSKLIEGRRFSVPYQNLHRETAGRAFGVGLITAERYYAILAEIDDISTQINPLFTRYHRTEIPD